MGGSHYFEVSEEESARFCVTVGGPLTETIDIHVETTDSAFALGKIKLAAYTVYTYSSHRAIGHIRYFTV